MYLHFNLLIPSLDNLLAIHYTTFTTTDGVIPVTVRLELKRAEEKAWGYEFIHPYRHRFIQALYPIHYEDYLRVIIPCNNHLLESKSFISNGRGVMGSELAIRKYHFKTITIHKLVHMN